VTAVLQQTEVNSSSHTDQVLAQLFTAVSQIRDKVLNGTSGAADQALNQLTLTTAVLQLQTTMTQLQLSMSQLQQNILQLRTDVSRLKKYHGFP